LLNFLSNSLKFTPEKGQVSVYVDIIEHQKKVSYIEKNQPSRQISMGPTNENKEGALSVLIKKKTKAKKKTTQLQLIDVMKVGETRHVDL